MRRTWLIAAVLLLAGLAGPAQAQLISGSVIYGVGSGELISEISIPALAQGDLTVSFHGDPGTGCAAAGLCSYSGTVVVRPGQGELAVLTVRERGRLVHQVEIVFGLGQTPYTTSARVERLAPGTPGELCADASRGLFGGTSAGLIRGHAVTIGLLAPDGALLQTRCAGPLDGDLAGVSPTVTVSLQRLLRGRMVLDLSGASTFASHGFAGTISSTVTVKLGKPQATPANPIFPSGVKVRRTRVVTEHLALTGIRGELSLALRGTGNPTVCRLLDTCGLTGTLSLGAARPAVSAEVTATGPASRPYGDFLTALGLSRSGRAHGIGVTLDALWTGAVRAAISQSGQTCSDTASTAAVALGLDPGSSGPFGGFTGSWRTRCPGPVLSGRLSGLSVSLAKGALAHRAFTIRARASGTLQDDGYVIVPHGDLSVLLRRGPVTQQVFSEPTG